MGQYGDVPCFSPSGNRRCSQHFVPFQLIDACSMLHAFMHSTGAKPLLRLHHRPSRKAVTPKPNKNQMKVCGEDQPATAQISPTDTPLNNAWMTPSQGWITTASRSLRDHQDQGKTPLIHPLQDRQYQLHCRKSIQQCTCASSVMEKNRGYSPWRQGDPLLPTNDPTEPPPMDATCTLLRKGPGGLRHW